jgi:hypothetical protein
MPPQPYGQEAWVVTRCNGRKAAIYNLKKLTQNNSGFPATRVSASVSTQMFHGKDIDYRAWDPGNLASVGLSGSFEAFRRHLYILWHLKAHGHTTSR